MKTFYRVFALLCFLGMTAFLKMDILSDYRVAPQAQSVCIGDLNQDGFNDIVVGNEFDEATHWGGVCILRNLGWGYFTFTDSIYGYAIGYPIATSQLDSCPRPEILFIHDDPYIPTEYIKICFNYDLNDTQLLDTHTYAGIDYLATGDIDGNGCNDIVIASSQGLFWGVFYNYGNRNFSALEIHHVSYSISGLAVGDLKNDGRYDVVLGGNIVHAYFSYPSGFQELQLTAGGPALDIAISDFDGDGYKDVLCADALGYSSTIFFVYKNLGNNTFQKISNFIFQPMCGSFNVADFNNDGLPDVIWPKEDLTGYIIWYNQGNFQLADSQFVSVPQISGEVSRSFCCADLDNNNFPDIVTIRFSVSRIHNVDIRFNDGNGNFGTDPIVGTQNHDSVLSSSLKNYPNPFQDETTFNFSLKETSIAELSVFDLHGKFITCLNNQKLEGGSHFIKWRGLDNGGKPCKPGAYIAYLKVNGKICQSIKLIKT